MIIKHREEFYRKKENNGRHIVRFDLTDNKGTVYPFSRGVPAEVLDIQLYLEENIEKYLLQIRVKEYLTCPKEKSIDLPTMEEWIKDGCLLRDEKGKITGKAEKVPWVSTHPIQERLIDGELISGETLEALKGATTIAGLRTILITILKGN